MDYNSTSERRNLTAYLIANSVCYIDRHVFYRSFFTLGRIVIPMILLAALVANVLTFISMRKLGHRLLPLCIYVSYLATFDIVDVIFRGGNILIESITRFKILNSAILLSTSSCQMIPMAYNIFKHAQGTLYIGLAIDNWRFIREPMRMFTVYRKEWVRNVFILSLALFGTVNSQFFWTFDVSENENKKLHGRTVKESYVCGFSTQWPLNQFYVEYIWPLLDLMSGEILPFFFTALFCVLSLSHMRKHKPNMDELSKFLINTDFVLRVNQTFTILLICYAIFSLPRVVYILLKYIFFGKISRKQAITYVNPNAPSTGKEPASASFMKRLTRYEPDIEIMEYIVKSCDFLFMIVKFVILLTTLPQFRKRCIRLTTLACFRKSKSKNTDEDSQRLNAAVL